MNKTQLDVFNTILNLDEALDLSHASSKTFTRALSGVRIKVPRFIESMNKLSYKELCDLRFELQKEKNYADHIFKKHGTLQIVSGEIDSIDYEASQCELDPEEHNLIGKKSYDELKSLKHKLGGTISWRLYCDISNNEQFHVGEQSVAKDLTNFEAKSYGDIADKVVFMVNENTNFSSELILEDDALTKLIGELSESDIKIILNNLTIKQDKRWKDKYEASVSLLKKELDMRVNVLYLIVTKLSDKIKTFEDLQEYLNDEGTNLSLFREEFVHKYVKKVPFILRYIFYKAHIHKKNNDTIQIETPDPNDILGNAYTREMKYKEREELIALCRSNTYKGVFGDLMMGDPLTIKLNKTALDLAKLSDSTLQKIIDRCTDGEKDSLVKYEKLELRLRKQFYEIYQGKSVKEILFRCIKHKHALDIFGRGRVIVWPLEVVYRLQQKVKEFYKNEIKETKEIPDDDMVNKPKHYMFNVDGNDVQAIDLVKGLLTPEEFRGWIKGSYFTYLMRADRKNGIEDLEKARTFLNWQIQLDKGEELTLPGKNDKGE